MSRLTGPQVSLKQSSISAVPTGQEDGAVSDDDRNFMMRYMQLKYSVLYLQKYRYLGKKLHFLNF